MSNVRPHKPLTRTLQNMKFIDESAFLTTFGREFSAALLAIPDFEPLDDPSSHDCYSVFVETFERTPTPESLMALRKEQFVELAGAFNKFFEVESVTPRALELARDAVLRHWEP
jgi:hypothetical protein